MADSFPYMVISPSAHGQTLTDITCNPNYQGMETVIISHSHYECCAVTKAKASATHIMVGANLILLGPNKINRSAFQKCALINKLTPGRNLVPTNYHYRKSF